MSQTTVGEVAEELEDLGLLYRDSAQSLASISRTVKIANIPDPSMVQDELVFSCFLIDESRSMARYSREVIEGQSEMIDILRKSHKCKTGALFVVQYLFSDEMKVLNEFAQLSPSGGDGVVLLNSGNNYNPAKGTALYRSLFYLLQDIAANYANAYDRCLPSSFTIGVITDGEDTRGRVQPSEIKRILDELQSREILTTSVIIGLTNRRFTKDMLEELRTQLGFQEAISLSQDDPRLIRRAFVLASQYAVDGQSK